jgi:MerR family transcriptional regulator, copper efflux regulator
VNVETVRYYEREGLIPKPPRGASGYRQFPPDAAHRLQFIRRAQDLGFSLAEIRELLALRVSPKTSCAAVKARAEAKIAQIESKISKLEAMKRTLHKLSSSCGGRGPFDDCPILASLDQGKSR